MSADGKIAVPARVQTPISNELDLQRVHRLRAEADAVLVGIGTVLADDPHLTVKQTEKGSGKAPIRVVLDSRGRTPPDARVLDGTAPTVIATNESCTTEFAGAEVVRCGKERVDLEALMERLHEREVGTLLVEGGGEVIWSFLEAGLVDELKLFVGPRVIGGRTSPTVADGEGAGSIEDLIPLKLTRLQPLGDGALLEFVVG
jgi:2,5-diamino-6-(ribosylamino)-4(3H)-pyrimidinone 5'-phosphate reductase